MRTPRLAPPLAFAGLVGLVVAASTAVPFAPVADRRAAPGEESSPVGGGVLLQFRDAPPPSTDEPPLIPGRSRPAPEPLRLPPELPGAAAPLLVLPRFD